MHALEGLSACPEARALLASPAFTRELAELDSGPYVQARRKIKLVHALLRPLAQTFFANGGERDPRFCAFLSAHPYAREYARFRAMVDAHGEPDRWPVTVSKSALAADEGEHPREAVHLFAQWQMHTQLCRVRDQASARGVCLYTDLPVGVHRAGFDMFREPACFVAGANVGAPPDALCPDGQDWGFAPAHPEGHRQQHYRYLRAYLRAQLEHAGMLRIDHVMGLSRLFCVPHGLGADQGLYLEQPAEELYAIVALEAARTGSVVVGEDLGTVPDEVRDTMRARGVQRMYVLPFELERDDRGAVRAREPAVDALATLNTHDMPTFAAVFHGADLDERESRGVLSEAEARVLRGERTAELCALARALGLNVHASSEELLRAATRYLGESRAQLVQVALEDLWGELRPQNVPGTFDPDRNFCRRMAFGLSSLTALPRVQALLSILAEARNSSVNAGRSPEALPPTLAL
jgi:4-alpha-glucanotransferase